MTTVCPKCMKKSSDDEQVCPRCGAILLSADERRDAVHDSDVPEPVGSATRVESVEALKEALEYLDPESETRAVHLQKVADEKSAGQPNSWFGIDRKWIASLGLVIVIAIGIVLFFALGSSNTSHPGGSTSPTVGTQSIFKSSGTGSSVTAPFSTTAAFTFHYDVNCGTLLTNSVVFLLQRSGQTLADVKSAAGTTSVNGTYAMAAESGPLTVAVQAPSSCKWTISGTS